MRRQESAEFREFVVTRTEQWRRIAYLLCRDWHLANDLVLVATTKMYRNWSRVSDASSPDAYARTILTRVWLDEQRRPWRRESSAGHGTDLPERPVNAQSIEATVIDRMTVDALLDSLAPRKRACVVLRFYCDLSVIETAQLLNVAPATVRSQTTRALEALRLRAATDDSQEENSYA